MLFDFCLKFVLVMLSCLFLDVLSQVWYLIVSIPDLCLLSNLK